MRGANLRTTCNNNQLLSGRFRFHLKPFHCSASMIYYFALHKAKAKAAWSERWKKRAEAKYSWHQRGVRPFSTPESKETLQSVNYSDHDEYLFGRPIDPLALAHTHVQVAHGVRRRKKSRAIKFIFTAKQWMENKFLHYFTYGWPLPSPSFSPQPNLAQPHGYRYSFSHCHRPFYSFIHFAIRKFHNEILSISFRSGSLSIKYFIF